MTSMVGLLGALSAGLAASTTKVEDDIDGGPHGGCCWRVQQRPPPRLKTTSMAGPMEGVAGGFSSIHH
jgi:hypothetical protein